MIIVETELYSRFNLVDFSKMGIQVGGFVATVLAQMAGKWFFTSMNPHVNFQVGISSGPKVAQLAGMGFCVRFGGNVLILKQYRVHLV